MFVPFPPLPFLPKQRRSKRRHAQAPSRKTPNTSSANMALGINDADRSPRSPRTHQRPRLHESLSSSHSHSGSDRVPRTMDVLDPKYYADSHGRDAEFVDIKVENTLFKIHKSVMMRDNSLFTDRRFVEGGSMRRKDRTMMVHLPENADQFRDLLWALHTINLNDPQLVYEPSINRLLNVAELARKYHFFAYELWAVDELYRTCESGSLPFTPSATTDSSSSITLINDPALDDVCDAAQQNVDSACGRLLGIACSARHTPLLLLLVKKIVVYTLWQGYRPSAVLTHALEALSTQRSRFQRHIRHLLGVVYYRMLVDMDYATEENGEQVVVFPTNMDVERRMDFLRAHERLQALWEDIRTHAPAIPDAHSSCAKTWERHWRMAARRAELSTTHCDCAGKKCRKEHRGHTADVLGLLKMLMGYARKSVGESRFICMECALAGLEGVDGLRDDVINGLGDLFLR